MTAALVTLTNEDPRFYGLIGPFLARREVVRDLGGHMWDDDGKTWTVAVDDGTVAGFIGAVTEKGRVRARSCYVLPGHPAVRRQLISAVVRAHAPSPVTATVRTDHVADWLACGFTVTGEKGKFTTLARKG